MPLDMNSQISAVAGVGPQKAKYLGALGIRSVHDLLRHFPRAYQNRGDAKTLCEAALYGQKCAVILTVGSAPQAAALQNHKILTKFTAFDETGSCTVTFFNQSYIKTVFHVGDIFRFFGRVERYRSTWQISSPDFEPVNGIRPLSDLYPIYPLTNGVSQKIMQNIIGTALAGLSLPPSDPIPEEIRKRAKICTLEKALYGIHRPSNISELAKAREYFIFEELFIFAAEIMLSKQSISEKKAVPLSVKVSDMKRFFEKLPFELTNAQRRVISEIAADLKKDVPMRRLVQGDVGSGKTVCAAAAAYICIKNGYQCALMAPTEILASQHYNDLAPLFKELGISTELLVGSMSAAKKKEAQRRVSGGEAQLVIGTHALISEGVEFKNLELIITDEQHRFGVAQRSALSAKSKSEFDREGHNLAMSATPIPRTLALALLSDIDVSIIDELPPGRQKVSTFLVNESYRQRLEGFICKQCREGRQVYVVCPAIESSEEEDEDCDLLSLDGRLISRKEELKLKSALDFYADFTSRFPEIKAAYLHGKMNPKEKDRVMSDYVAGKISVLISTTVIEVGVNVPNSTLMVIENAERFGLSQLHQLRGRVGRGKYKSWCILVSDSEKDQANERLNAFCKTNDGFEIAKADLRLRGPGDFFAALGKERQHGRLSFRFASLCDNSETLDLAFAEAKMLIESDPALQKKENACLRDVLSNLMSSPID